LSDQWGTSKLDWFNSPAVWVHRGGRTGEFEEEFVSQGAIGIYWEIDRSFNETQNWDDLSKIMRDAQPDRSQGSIAQFTRMAWDFFIGYKIGDLVVMPRRGTQEFAVGKVTGQYEYRPENPVGGLPHLRSIEWLSTDSHKSLFPSDVASLLTPRKTIQRVTATDSHSKVLRVAQSHTQTSTPNSTNEILRSVISDETDQDIETAGRQQIANYIGANYKDHDFAALVEKVLEAQGFKTYLSPPGPDGGVDILAGMGSLGLDSPKLCVQVKSGNSAVDRMTLDQLIGAMQNFGAEQGLLVAWGGFKRSVSSVRATQWFNVRLWDRDGFIDALLDVFPLLDEDIRSTLPFKQVWALSVDPRL
jgi:restriction system protein